MKSFWQIGLLIVVLMGIVVAASYLTQYTTPNPSVKPTQGIVEPVGEVGMLQVLRRMEQSLREQHGINATLQEQLEKAIANEEYEAAARLRDAIRKGR